jgi:rhodanese-related sulfurtransferase
MLRMRLSAIFTALLAFNLHAEVTQINNQTLDKMRAEGVPIIDVRRAEEWQQTGIVENSHLLTFFNKKGQYNLNKWLESLDKIVKKDEPLILICRTGNRTGTISNALDKQLGYSKVYNVQKGITDWKRNSFPVVKVDAVKKVIPKQESK